MEIFHKLNSKITKLPWAILILILALGFAARLYKFSAPVADWHSWRQTDTSAVSRSFVQNGFDLLHPRFEDISNVASGFENPNGYRFVEFPIYNILQAGGYLLFKTFTLEEWGRLVTIFGGLFCTVFIYLITKKYAGVVSGLFAAFFYTIIPFDIFYGRTLLPDVLMISTTFGAIYFFDSWVSAQKIGSNIFKTWVMLVFSIMFIAGALLLKPFAAFFLLPIVYVALKEFGWKALINFKLWIIVVCSIAPLVFWRIWMMQYPAGIASSSWLFNAGNIRFTGAYFNWIFATRIGQMILGFWGIGIFVIGLVSKHKNKTFFITFILSSLLYMVVVARGNVQHDYYQIPIMPSIAIFLGLGSSFMVGKRTELSSRWLSIPIFIICVLFMLAFDWFNIRMLYDINNPAIIRTGEAVERLTPKNAKIIAPYDGDTTLLYYTNRQGWPSFEHDLPVLIKLGADYLVLVNPKPADYGIGKTYKITSATSDYILFDLHKKP